MHSTFKDEVATNIRDLELEGKTVISVMVDSQPALIISLEEAHLAKAESKVVVNYLRENFGYRVAMITGDNEHSAFKVADYLGISREDVVSKAYPWTKKETVEKF